MVLISIFAAYYYIRPIKLLVFSMLLKPKFLVDIPFFSVFFISLFFLFNLQILIHLDQLINICFFFNFGEVNLLDN